MIATTPVVLVVDDDPSFCTIMREFLSAEGYNVHVAYDVPQALKILEGLTPDLILSDIMMPDIDGICLLRSVRAAPAWARIPLIIVSAKTMPQDRLQAMNAGADAFVPKPFSIKELRFLISKYLQAPLN